MKDRIKAIRKDTRQNQTDFGRSVGVTLSAEQKWELGLSVPSESAIMNIVSKYGINEEWLRTGEGAMYLSNREAALRGCLLENLPNRSEAFREALLDTLQRFDPAGPEWSALENILLTVVEKMQR